ncbi:PepSY domain-containing protein [Gluconobacter sp. Dm-62]|uniref:PepSY-associated TM helix domain-containing protein n=1 Tax=Gluconobacter sp. Dm-62 TaxID=2799804 RepID=UPI001B8ABB42|nr:PepSY-associated TM helix domain-containing protein [Gluconobacter sp. Dm-62]MBS1101586.1 PepSY domain-containing protein [Gluconobacter sp. Dm-62]
MQDTLRTRMGWLHAWVGFAAGLVLFCVFATGCLAMFDTELTRWLQPEVPPQTGQFSPRSLDHVLPAVQDLIAQGEKPFITLPSVRDPYLRLQHHDGYEFLTVPYNPQTGDRLTARATAGGTFFYNLHYTMRSGIYGETIIALAGLALLVTIGSGIIIHLKGLVSDLTLLRPFAARLRAWLDVHVVASVPFLPFIILMAYSGTFIRARTLFPPVSYTTSIENTFRTSVPSGPEVPEKPTARPVAPLPPLAPILSEAEQTLGAGQVGFILFLPQSILVSRTDASGPLLTREHVDFSPIDSHVLRHVLLPSPITHTQQLLDGLHYARWTGPGMRWLYFLSGAMGAVMFASGSVIFLMKRRRQSGHRLVFRIAEGLAIGSIAGFPIATLGFFWANRILPVGLPDRPFAEGHVFFAVWALSALAGLGWSILYRPFQGWKIQLCCLAVLGLLLTPLDVATRPGITLFHVPTVFAATDMVALVLALISFQVARRL